LRLEIYELIKANGRLIQYVKRLSRSLKDSHVYSSYSFSQVGWVLKTCNQLLTHSYKCSCAIKLITEKDLKTNWHGKDMRATSCCFYSCCWSSKTFAAVKQQRGKL